MKRKLLIVMLSLISVSCLAVGLSACNNGSNEHSLVHYEAVDPTETEDGNIEYWYCTDCGGYFRDENGNFTTTYEDTVKEKMLLYDLSDDGSSYSVYFNTIYREEDISKTINIPSTYNSLPVTAIKENGFMGCWNTEIITIPDTVTYIGDNAFQQCHILESIIIGNSVKTICFNAFFECYALESITIPDSVETIGKQAFAACTSLKEIVIPDSVQSIGIRAFSGCTSLESIVLPFAGSSSTDAASTYLGYFFAADSYSENAARVPSSLKKVEIRNGAIDEYAFYGCYGLTSITIGSNVSSIENYAFYGCTALTEINFNATALENLHSENHIFSSAGQDTDGITVNVGENVTKIPTYLFNSCAANASTESIPNITNVVFEENSLCTSIGEGAFSHCSYLTNINLPDGLIEIGRYAFQTSVSLDTIVIPDTVESIGSSAFASSLISSITIPGSVTEISAWTFNNCFQLKEVILSSGTLTIDDYAFCNCIALENFVIPDTVTTIGTYAFADCNSLESITFENTSGWYATKTEGATNGTDILSADLETDSTAATYLTTTYYSYYWYRSESVSE